MCFANGTETPSNSTFNVHQFKFSNCRMGLMKLCNCGMHGINCTFEMLKLDNVLDGITDKMNNIWEVEHGWNLINKKFMMESGIASTIAHNSAYSRPSNLVNHLQLNQHPNLERLSDQTYLKDKVFDPNSSVRHSCHFSHVNQKDLSSHCRHAKYPKCLSSLCCP